MIAFAFWAGVALVAYTYVGYPVVAWALARVLGRPNATGPGLPMVTLLIAAHNEEDVIAAKIENSLALDYPADRLEIMVVADGCSDRTCEVVSRYVHLGVRLVVQEPRAGKVAALNRGVPMAQGEVVVGSDANAMYRPDALRRLVRHFEDPEVGMAAGEKRVLGAGNAAKGEGLYWRYEHFLKQQDSLLSSAMGATGEIFAIRKALWKPVPGDSIIEDFVISMGVVQGGHRVIFDPSAVSEEQASPDLREEFKRKVRITAGGWQSVVRLWPLLSPTYGRVAFQYVSHRVLRWVVVPLLLPLLLVLNAVMAVDSRHYLALMGLHLAFYAAAFAGYAMQAQGRRPRATYVPFYFAYLNVAALCGGWRYLRNAQPVTWEKVRRAEAT
ncbi:MAG: glycosyl transferase family 2 [Cyanobacteria bacterium RYN_339]|nr:glycosyl transferase family 2 [Cyanobacteria bacterium RYN_339]